MEDKKYIWIALAFMPVFLLPVAFNLSVDDGQTFKLSTFLGCLVGMLLVSPIYYYLFNLFKNRTAGAYNKSKIKWGKWEILGKRRFITYRVFFQTIIALIVSYFVAKAINYFYDNKILIEVICISVYTMFSCSLISNNYLWQFHQQKKTEPQR
ncbi:MAG: hypothetical protein GY839_10075 [candidate division Zixibacteria bacterium]|nr:hypothetical protein [candidate division Zixibacteria bacterium]